MIQQLVLFALGADAKSNAKDFTYDLAMSWCEGLTAANSKVTTEDACSEACYADDDCTAWLFCPHGTQCSVPKYNADNKYGKAVCLTGAATSCIPYQKGNYHWKGAAKTAVAPPGRTKPATRARGFSGFTGSVQSVATCDDAKALNLQDSWYYNWLSRPSKADICLNAGYYPSPDQGFEYVPMISSINIANVSAVLTDELIQEWNWGNVHYLLGYNEPDQSPHQGNPETGSSDEFREDPKKAAKHWIQVQEAAKLFDPPLTLVSPAPLDSKISDEGVAPWLDEFFAECERLDECYPDDIEYIAFHSYTGDIDQLNGTIYGMHNRYTKTDGTKRLMWITEVGLGYWNPPSGPPMSEKIAYMEKLLPFLDSHPLVMRYAWYTARTHGQANWSGPTSLLPNTTDAMTPTAIGELYRDTPDSILTKNRQYE